MSNMRNYLSIFLILLFFTSNQVSAYEIKRSISDLEKMLKEEIYFDNCRSVFGVTGIDKEDTYKMSVLIKHNPKNFRIKEIIFLSSPTIFKNSFALEQPQQIDILKIFRKFNCPICHLQCWKNKTEKK